MQAARNDNAMPIASFQQRTGVQDYAGTAVRSEPSRNFVHSRLDSGLIQDVALDNEFWGMFEFE